MAPDGKESAQGDLQRWLEEVERLPIQEFTARHRGLFFVTEELASDAEFIVFETSAAVTPREAARDAESRGAQVSPIAKSDRSPYKDRISIGRARNCDVVLRHPSISKLHAHVRPCEGGRYLLVDLASHNGTRLNDRALLPNLPAELRVGDVVAFGVITARALDAAALYAALTRWQLRVATGVVSSRSPRSVR